MSAPNDTKRALDDLVRSARDARTPEPDWATVEAKLFARIATDAAEKRRRAAHPMWIAAAGALAAAAAVAIVVARPGDAPIDTRATTAQAEPAGVILARDGEGDVIVDGKPAVAGATLAARAVVETRGSARALVERTGAEKKRAVAFWIEPASRVVVTRTQGTLVLALERGAIEAEVSEDAIGEALAVDVGAARVATHGARPASAGLRGPHVRVARDGARVVVDVNGGIVAIGTPPRIGETTGSLVASPAHAEFTADDALATLTIDHAASAVRPAIAFAIPSTAVEPTAAIAPAPTTPPTAAAPTHAPITFAPKTAPSGHSPTGPQPDPNAEATIARAVRACIAVRPPAAGVKLTVSTIIDMTVGDDGAVQRARFDPPLAPETQACATAAIYRVHFTHGGAVSIPIDHAFE
jgi:hypothetical protein